MESVGSCQTKFAQNLDLDPNMKAHNLNEDEIAKINAVLTSQYVVEGRPATPDPEQYQALDQHSLLSRNETPIRTSCQRPTHAYECTYTQR